MTTALSLLIVQGVLGGLDTLIYHELLQRLPHRATGRLELRLHASRDFAYAILFGSLAWVAWQGWWALVLAALLVVEILITLWDFLEEDLRRPLPPGERIMHTVMAIVYGGFLAYLAPQLVLWGHQPTRFASSDYGWISWVMTAMAVGVLLSGIRDLWASCRLPESAETAPPHRGGSRA
jgi:hypothetical protein